MGRLVIDDIDDATLESLRVRAAAHGTTPEEEARAILQQWAADDALCERLGSVRAVRSPGPRVHGEDLIRDGRDEH